MPIHTAGEGPHPAAASASPPTALGRRRPHYPSSGVRRLLARVASGRRPRRTGGGTAVTGAVILALAFGGLEPAWSGTTAAAAASGYAWKNVQIVGGGFVPGIEYSRAVKGLVYARTDIGGIYRRDPGSSVWTPLTDWVGPDEWGWGGSVSLAPDPVDGNRVYAAVGMYTNSWDPNDGAVLRSADRGATWQVARLPFKLGSNMPGRGMGERLAVDPHRNSVLYLGAPDGNGLWRSTDAGATWSKVTSFTNPGSYSDKPGDSYQGVPNGIVWVTFDPRSGSGTGASATATKTIYVGVADKDNPVYRSTDAGATWSPVKGTPTGFLAHKGVLDDKTGMLFIATSDKAGPYDGSHGDVWRLDTATDTWKQISPVPSSDSNNNYFGYSGLTVDRQKPGTLMVASYNSWWPDTQFWRSTDSGATWTKAWDWTSYPNRSFRYSMDISAAPWLDFNNPSPSPPDASPKLGWMTEAMEIDPFDSNGLLYGTGATVYGTTDLTDWDSSKVRMSVMAKGIEETAVLDMMSPPDGVHLISGLGDIGGFRHDDLDTVPKHAFTQPTVTNTTALDYAEANASVMVRAGNVDRSAHPNDKALSFSTDGGKTWFQANAEPPNTTYGGSVAASADGARFVWAPTGGAVSYSVGFGNSWTPVKGLDIGATVKSDRVNPKTFYAMNAGRFFVSTDGGATFTQTVGSGLPGGIGEGQFRAVPGREGEVWLSGDSGLFRSTDAGRSFTKVASVDKAWSVGFGMAAPGRTYPAVYTSAKLNGHNGIYRSDDAGASWVRINDDAHQWGITSVVIGDPRIYGRVYVAGGGRGIVYGEPSGSAAPAPVPSIPAPTTSKPTTPKPTTSTQTGATTSTPTPTSDPERPAPTTSSASGSAPTGGPLPGGPACSVRYRVGGQWPNGFLGQVMVTNTGNQPIKGWQLAWRFTGGQLVTSAWGVTADQSGDRIRMDAMSWNALIPAGGSAYLGFIGTWSQANQPPGAFTLNGSTCAVS